jgi:hypothetical protein
LKLVEAGPEGGPYHILSFADVPDNVIPSSPASNLMGLHLLYNGLMRKQSRQAKRQKVNPVYRPSGAEDADRLKRVSDGEWVKVNDPSGVSVISQGGVDQTNVAFSIAVLDLFDRQAGNLRAMAGLGPSASTVGQEELVYSAASRKEAKMQHRVHDFVARLMQSVGHMMWVDEVLTVQTQEELAPGTGIYADRSWTPEHREGDFWQYSFDIDPYSTNYEPPEFKAQKVERAIQQMVNLYPMLQQVGGTIDVQELVRYYAEAMGIPELENVITFTQSAAPPQQTGDTRMPTETTRNYVRHNIPTGGTPEARNSVLQQALLRGGSATPSQEQSVLR